MDIEDLEPRKQPAKPRDLGTLSIEELEDYITRMEAEIARVRAAIAAKRAQRNAAAAFFKT